MRKRSPSTAMGLMMAALLLTACGGDDAAEVDPITEGQADAPGMSPVTPAGPATAPPAAGAPGAGGADAAAVQAGQQIFAGQGLCFTCHGQQAQGTPLAPPLTDGQWLWIEDPANDLETQLATLIRTGVSEPREYPAPMPPMGGAQLSEEQLSSVVAYVLSLNP